VATQTFISSGKNLNSVIHKPLLRRKTLRQTSRCLILSLQVGSMRHRFNFRSGLLFVALTSFAAGVTWTSAAQTTVPSDTPAITLSQKALSLELAPAESRRVRITLAAGATEAVSAEQSLGGVEVKWIGAPALAAQEPRSNPAGLHSRINLTLLSHGAGAEELSIRNLSATKPATVELTATSPHPGNAEDRQQVDAEAALAHAELLRAQRNPATYPDTLRSYDSAATTWRALHDDRNLSRALTWKALFLFVNQSDAASALPVTEEAAKYISSLDTPEAANCAKITGYVHVQLAQYDAGRTAYTSAIHLFEQTHDLYNQEVLLDNLSRLERLQGNTDAALADAERADTLASELGDVKRQLKIKAEIGAVNLSASRLEAAYAAYQAALTLLQQSPDSMTEGYVWSDLGVLYTLLHQPGQARDALDQAMAVWKRSPDPVAEINTLDDYGELWMTSRKLPLARDYYNRGLTLATRESLPRPQIYLLRGLGATYLLDNDLPRAAENLERALSLAVQIKEGDGLPDIYCLLGDLHVRQHQENEAEKSYQLCRQTAASSHDAYADIRAEGSLARLQFERGNVESAAEYSERALAGIETARQSIPEQDLRTSFFSSMRSYYDLAIDILEALEHLHPDSGYQWQAFLTAERARARMLLDQVSAQPVVQANAGLVAERDSVDDALRAQQRALQRTGISASRAQQLHQSIARLTVRRDAFATEIAAQANTADDDALSLKSVQNLLPLGRSALLEYWIGERGSFLWSITHAGLHVFHLPPTARIQGQSVPLLHSILSIATHDTSLTAEQRADFAVRAEHESSARATALRQLVLPMGAIPVNAQSLLVVEDGPLLSLPLAAVFSGPSGVPDSCDILIEPSAAFLSQLLDRAAPQPQQTRIAIFANTGTAPSHQQELPFVSTEVRSIQAVFGRDNARLFTGAAATPQAIRNFDWGNYSIGHFATHAVLDRENMQLTGMVLAPSGNTREPDTEMLWYGDVCRLHARLDLVVLSACDTASGEMVPGEGLVGLTQAFFTAGSQRVLGSLWPVDDEATSTLMRYFYTSLQTTRSPAAALRTAQRRMAATGPWQSPYYWSGFSLAGDWRKLP
jgi:CHAT domain-containing protein